MNIFTRLKQITPKIGFIRRIRLTQTAVVAVGTMLLVLFAIAILLWDASLFLQSLSGLQPKTATSSQQVSLTAQDINDAINILDNRQQQFNALIHSTAGTSTISF